MNNNLLTFFLIKILKGSYVNNLDIIQTWLILNKINDIKIDNCNTLKKYFQKIKNNNETFINLDFENGEKLILKTKKIIQDDLFLSKEFNYDITYWKKLKKKYPKIPLERSSNTKIKQNKTKQIFQ